MSGLDAKIFGVRDVIYILAIAGGLFANWYTMDERVGILESANANLKDQVIELKESNKTYASLPNDVKKMQLDIAKNAKTTTAIYYGLLAKGIIKPPQ